MREKWMKWVDSRSSMRRSTLYTFKLASYSLNRLVDMVRTRDRAQSLTTVVIISTIFVFITLTTTFFVVVVCCKRNAVFALNSHRDRRRGSGRRSSKSTYSPGSALEASSKIGLSTLPLILFNLIYCPFRTSYDVLMFRFICSILSLVASSHVPTGGFHTTKIGLSTTSSLPQWLQQVDVQSRQRIQRLWTLWDGSVAVLGHRRRWLLRRRWWRSGQSGLPGCVQPSTFSKPQSTRRRRTSGAVVAESSPVNAFSRWLGNKRKSNHPSRPRFFIVRRNRKQKWRHTVADVRLSMFTDTGSRHAVGRWR